jgi:hypothetical protein
MKTMTPQMLRIQDCIKIRPLAKTERAGLAEASSRLSKETRQRRFGGLASRLSEHDLDRLTMIDHQDHEALAALAPDTGQIAGVARYIALPGEPGAAEVAIARRSLPRADRAAHRSRAAGEVRRFVRPLIEESRRRRQRGEEPLFNSQMFDGSTLPHRSSRWPIPRA